MKPAKHLPALLNKHEVQRFRAYLYPPRKPEKMIELFRLLREHGKKELSREEKQKMEKKIYGKASGGKQFDMLSHRLQKKITGFLLSDAFLKEHPLLETLHAEQVEVNRKWTQHYILKYTGRGGYLADALINEAIEGAKKYECYTNLIQMLHSRRLTMYYRLGEKEIDKAEKDIARYTKCEQAVRRASELYYRALARKKFSANPDIPSLQKFLKNSIKELAALHKQTRSPEVQYFLKYLEMDFHQNEKKFRLAIKKCAELMDVINNNVSVFTKQRIDYMVGNVVQCQICDGRYSHALEFLRMQTHILPYSLDWYESREMELRIYFYRKQYKKAKALLDVMLKNFPDDMEPVRKARIQFLLACVWFMLRDFKKAQALLIVNSELHKDKSGWAISIRMLELMLLCEENNKEECMRKVKQLKKFLLYSHVVSKRDELMADLFLHIATNNFVHKRIKQRVKKTHRILSMKKGDYAWDTMSHEIIRYDGWVGKLKPRP